MNLISKNRSAGLLLAFACGFAIAYSIFCDELRKVTYSLNQAQAALNSDRITIFDKARSTSLNARERNGEYILKFERPVDKKLMQAGIEAFAYRLASNNAPAFRAILSKLNCSIESIDRLEEHRWKIVLASLETEMAMEQLLLARQAYDARIRSLLSADFYAQYRNYEDARAAASEYNRLEEFATRLEIQLDPGYMETVIAAIQRAQAYSGRSWHGPYDGWPEIAMGQREVVSQLESQSRLLSSAFATLRKALDQPCFPKPYLDVIDSYYCAQFERNAETLSTVLSSTPQASQ